MIHNLDVFPYPFENNSVELIEMNHVLEHLCDPFKVMSELHRILIDGGRLIINVPHFSRGLTHPEHKRCFDVSFPLYFNAAFHGGFTGFEFNLESMKISWFGQPYLMKTVLNPLLYYPAFLFGRLIDFFANLNLMFCSRIWCFLVGGFQEIEFVFKCKK